jgi:hypothetical protein
MTSPRKLNAPIAEGTLLIDEPPLPDARAHDSVSMSQWLGSYCKDGTISMNVSGFDRSRMIQTAVVRRLTAVTLQKWNCLELDQITMHSFCRIPSVNVLAQTQHIQQESSRFHARSSPK